MDAADSPAPKISVIDVLTGVAVGAVYQMMVAAHAQKPWWVQAACWAILGGTIVIVVLLSNSCSRGCRRRWPDNPERRDRCLRICGYITAGLFLLALGIAGLLCNLVADVAS